MPNPVINRRLFQNSTRRPIPIGQIFKIVTNQLSDLSAFTINTDGTTSITLDAGYIKIIGSPAVSIFPLDNYIRYDGWTTGLKSGKVKIRYIPKSLIAADQGIILGWVNDSSVPNLRSDWNVHYRRSGSTANGDGYRYFNGTTTLTPNVFNTSPLTTEVTPIVDHEYEITIERSATATGARFTLTIADVTPGFENSQSGSLDYTYANTAGQLDMSSSKFFIGTTGGEHWVSLWEYESSELKNVDWIIPNDSISAGYNASLRANHYVSMLEAAYPNVSFNNCSCQGDGPDTVLNKTAEINLINAKSAWLWNGTNPAIQEGAAAAIAYYDAQYALLQSAGVTRFVHTTPLPRLGSAAIAALRTHILTTYASDDIIDAYLEANDPGNPGHMKAIYVNAPDFIHPNDAFFAWYFTQATSLI